MRFIIQNGGGYIPTVKKNEKRSDYLKRCIPYVIKKEGLDQKAAVGKCNGMYNEHLKKKKKKGDANIVEQYEEGKTYDFPFSYVSEFPFEPTKETDDFEEYEMIIVKSNIFMRGIYMSHDFIKKIHKGFENTMHDMNHKGTGYAAGFTIVPSDLSYFVGFQYGIHYENSEVRAIVHIDKHASRYSEWKNYVNLAKQMNKTPNVSMFIKGKIEFIEARKLPKECHYRANGYKADDVVPCMVDGQPVAVSSVFQGACDDKAGCGIKHDCTGSECDVTSESIKNEQRREFLKNRMKSIRGK